MDLVSLLVGAVGKFVAAVALAIGALASGMLSYQPAVAPPTDMSTTTEAAATSTVATTMQSAKQKTSELTSPQPGPVVPQTSSPKPDKTITPITIKPPVSTISPENLNFQTRAALVNILCTTLVGGAFEPISGSGVIIDSRGIILTNAHVAQFLLLRDYIRPGNVDCVIRTGSPAQARYRATLMYLPPAWIDANAAKIKQGQPKGTGEYDYAFLLITSTTNPSVSLPASFPYLSMRSAEPVIGESMLLAAYPAGFLSGELISTNLFASSAFAFVTQLFSFAGTADVDLFSIGGSIVSQAGSSGGAAVRASDGSLAGVISTATLDGATTGERDLRAVTIDYINRDLKEAGKGGLKGFLSQNANATTADFNSTVAPDETKKLEAALSTQ